MYHTRCKIVQYGMFVLMVSLCFSGTYYVDDDAPNDPGPGDTTVSDPLEDGSAAHPFDAIAEAIAADPNSRPIILLAEGVYTGAGNYDIWMNREFTIEGQSSPDNCVIDLQNAIERGFFIGSATSPVSISNISFRNSLVDGAILIQNASATITNCIFKDNYSTNSGGAIRCTGQSVVTIKETVFRQNTSEGLGGAICNYNGGRMHLVNCLFSGNSSSNEGGGIYSDKNSDLYLKQCRLLNNEGGLGGGVYIMDGMIEDCRIQGNAAAGGGGIFAGGTVSIQNSLICGNTALEQHGGGIRTYGIFNRNYIYITNCSIVNNRAMQGWGGGFHGDGTIVNSIIRDNVSLMEIPDSGQGNQLSVRSFLLMDHCNVSSQEGDIFDYNGEAQIHSYDIIDSEPNFVDPGYWDDNGSPSNPWDDTFIAGNYRLGADSSCIDAGDNDIVGLFIEQDLGGQIRTLDGDQDGQADIDMGCYEFSPAGMGVIETDPLRVYFTCRPGDALQQSQTVKLYNSGDGLVNWTLQEDCSWLDTDITSGSADANGVDIELSIDAAGMDPNVYTCDMLFVDPAAVNDPYTLTVVLYVVPEVGCWVPFHYPTIQQAIDAAADESIDTVVLADDMYMGQGNVNVSVRSEVTLKSATGADHCIIFGAFDVHHGIEFASYDSVVLDGLTMTRFTSDEPLASAILCHYNPSDLLVKNCILLHNSNFMYRGAAVKVFGCRSVFENCLFLGNLSDSGGAFYVTNSEEGPVQFFDCVFRQNVALGTSIPANGGAVYLRNGQAEFEECLFTENVSFGSGGAIQAVEGSSAEIRHSDFIGNRSVGNGGGVCYPDVVEDCRFIGNVASNGHGGGLYCEASSESTLVVNRCLFDGNEANMGDSGGGMFFLGGYDGHLILTDSHFIRNKIPVYGYGGGIYAWGGIVEMDHVIIEGNYPEGLSYSYYNESYWPYPNPRPNPFIEGQGLFVKNSLIYGNRSAGPFTGMGFAGTGSFCNSIIWANESEDRPVEQSQLMIGGGRLDICYTDLMGGTQNIQQGGAFSSWGTYTSLGNLDIDPLFVSPGYWEDSGTPGDWSDDTWVAGDYHLKSQGWRWDAGGEQWSWDDVTSRCIDAGHPGMALEDELSSVDIDPHDDRGENIRVNIGVYGRTSEAGIAPAGWALLADMSNDGIVNLVDFSVLAADWLSVQENCPGDLTRQGGVTVDDLALLANDWLNNTIWY